MPKNGVGIVNLATGQATTVAEHVKSFRVPDDTPKIVVYLTVAAETGGGHRGGRRSGVAEDARKETIRHRPGDSRSLVERTDDGRGSQRLRAEQGRRMAGLRRVVEDGGDMTARSPAAWRTGRPESPDRPRQLQGVCVRRRRPAGRVRQRSRRLHVTGAALQAVSLDVFGRLGDRTADPGRRIDDCAARTAVSSFRRTAAGSSSARPRRPPPNRPTSRPTRSKSTSGTTRTPKSSRCRRCAPRGEEAHLPRGVPSGRQDASRSWRRATCPTC